VPATAVVLVGSALPRPQPVVVLPGLAPQLLLAVLAMSLAEPAGLTAPVLAAQPVDRRLLHPVRFW
jgi:hypothetical protein